MRCPKCGYHSFDTQQDCKKCGQDLVEHKGKFRVGGVLFAPFLNRETVEESVVEDQAVESGSTGVETPPAEPAGASDEVDFGFGLMDDEQSMPDPEPQVDATSTSADADPGLDDSFSFDDAGANFSEESPAVDTDTPDLNDVDDVADLFGSSGDDDFDFNGQAVVPEFDAVTTSQDQADLEVAESPIEAETSGDELDEEDLAGLDLNDLVSFTDEPLDETTVATGISQETEPEVTFEETDEGSESADDDARLDAFEDRAEATDVSQDVEDYEGITELPEDDDDLPASGTAASNGEESLFDFGEASWRKGRNEQKLSAQALAEADAMPADAANLEGQGLFALNAGSNGVAGLGARIAASAFDIALLVLVGVAFLMAGEMAMGKETLLPPIDALMTLGVYYYLVFFAWFFSYFTFFHFLSGETPGKMLFRIRVEAIDGTGLSLSQAFLRSVGGLISLVTLGLGYLIILFNSTRRGWNDRIAGTQVVFSRAEAQEGEQALA